MSAPVRIAEYWGLPSNRLSVCFSLADLANSFFAASLQFPNTKAKGRFLKAPASQLSREPPDPRLLVEWAAST